VGAARSVEAAVGTVSAAPYLSIVLVGRNDGYGGDFNERFFRALTFNHQQLQEAGVSHDFVFVEWAPVAGQPLLAELFHERLGDAAGSITTYVVNARYQTAYSLNSRLKFMEFIAKNVGILRAGGAWILATNTDIYLSRGVIDVLAARSLEPRTLYRATRIDLKLGADLTHVDWALLEDVANQGPRRALKRPLFTGAAGDFQLLDRESWLRLRGFNEVYRLARIGIDANFCAKAYANGYRIADIGAPVYHLNHIGSFRSSRGMYRDRPGDAPWGDERWDWRVIYENPESWGLGLAPVTALGKRMHYLDYAEGVAPPLLDLRRVLLPAARTRGEDAELGLGRDSLDLAVGSEANRG
jgi:hypothetical protein